MEMSPWIENACITIMLISLVINNIGAYSSVELDKSNCDTKILYISRDIKQTIEWQGDTVIPSYCRVGFEDTDDNPYSICIKFKAFRILACDFAIKVYKDLSKLSIKTYDCVSEDVNDRCFDSKNIYLGFLSNYTGGYTNTKVKIEVYAKEDAETVSGIAGIAVPIVFVLCVFGTCSACIKNGCKCLQDTVCPSIESVCRSISECGLCDRLENLTSSARTNRHTEENIPTNITEEPTEMTTTRTDGDSSESLSINSLALELEVEEHLSPSAPPAENDWAPPPYIAPPSDEALPDAPPPSYYDVINQNI